ncbi:MAG: hypothetical protein HZB49_27395 [Bradyrhizobium sp.]|nr:hypothetical protein [Bradyrhizobium sp.]
MDLRRRLVTQRGDRIPLSCGPDQFDLYHRAAGYVDRILKGANPGHLPVQAPTRCELVVNLKTANALGLHWSGDAPCDHIAQCGAWQDCQGNETA